MNIKWVWKLKVPPRVQFFWWKIVQGRLLCKSYLYERGVINNVNASCDICTQVLEDANAILISCPYANAQWNELSKLNKGIHVPNSLMDIKGKLFLNQVVPLNKSFMAIISWIIWTGRNDRLFQQVELTPTQLMRKVQGFFFT